LFEAIPGRSFTQNQLFDSLSPLLMGKHKSLQSLQKGVIPSINPVMSENILLVFGETPDVHGALHHNTNLIEMTYKDATVYDNLFFHCSLTVQHVWRNIIAHHQELLNCNFNFWFYSCLSLPAAVMPEWELNHDSS
jgi:hypothetical protein